MERGERGSKTQRSARVIYLREDEAISGTTELADFSEPILSLSLFPYPSFPRSLLLSHFPVVFYFVSLPTI